jgi:hypothetical protein
VKNITLDRTTVLQLDADGTDGALDAAADCHVLRNDVAVDLCAIADLEIRGAQLAFDSAQNLRWTIAFDFANDRHVGADARGPFRCRPWPRPGLVMRLHRPPHDFGRIERVLVLAIPANVGSAGLLQAVEGVAPRPRFKRGIDVVGLVGLHRAQCLGGEFEIVEVV